MLLNSPCCWTSKWTTWVASVLMVLLCLTATAQGGIKCFTCSTIDNEDPCVTSPTQVNPPDKECVQEDGSDGWCHIRREEFTDIPGKITSFVRLCINTREPAPYDDVITSGDKTTYFRTCRTNRCNSGSGIEESSSGGGSTNTSGLIIVRAESGGSGVFGSALLVAASVLAGGVALKYDLV